MPLLYPIATDIRLPNYGNLKAILSRLDKLSEKQSDVFITIGGYIYALMF